MTLLEQIRAAMPRRTECMSANAAMRNRVVAEDDALKHWRPTPHSADDVLFGLPLYVVRNVPDDTIRFMQGKSVVDVAFPSRAAHAAAARVAAEPADAYSIPRRTLDEADTRLERVYRIAQDLADTEGRIATGRARRAARRIMDLVEGVDEALGLGEDGE